MRDRYTYEQIVEATRRFLAGVERGDSNVKISEDTHICLGRIKTWKHRHNYITITFENNNADCLQYISNLTYGVSEDVFNRWLRAIDNRLDEIRRCGALSNDIRTILEEIAAEIDAAVAPKKGTTVDMIDRVLAHLVDETRNNDNRA